MYDLSSSLSGRFEEGQIFFERSEHDAGGGTTPADATMTTIYLERREPAYNRQRFYTLTVAQTLFGSWTLIREWGRIGHPGTVRETWFESESAATEAGAKIRRQKEKRGYRAIGGAGEGLTQKPPL